MLSEYWQTTVYKIVRDRLRGNGVFQNFVKMFCGISSNEWWLNGEVKCKINACKNYTYFTLNATVSRICWMEYLR